MKVDLMRKVDYWIGIPLCWLLSFFNLFCRYTPHKDIKKVLFLKLSEMGSTVLAYPAIKEVMSNNPGTKIYFLAFEENKQIIKTLKIIPESNIITIDSSGFFGMVRSSIKALLRIRKEKIDATIDLEFFARITAILAFLSGSRIRCGFYKFHAEGAGRGNFLTHKVNYNHYLHTSQAFFSLAKSINHDPSEIPMLKSKIPELSRLEVVRWKTSEEQKDFIREKLKIPDGKVVLLNPNSSQLIPFRKWPLEKWILLTKRLVGEDKVVGVIGTEQDRADAQEIIKACPEVLDFTGKTTIPELLDLYNVSDLLISNDSGPAHFAAMTPIKIISIFGPETPLLYSPLSKNNISITLGLACTPCISVFNMRRTPCKNNLCLKNIPVDMVYDVYKKQMEGKK